MKAASCSSRPAAGVGLGGAVRLRCAVGNGTIGKSVIGAVGGFVCEQAARYGRILLVLDRSNPPRTAVRQLQPILNRRLQVEWLPPYAPDLNPAEQLWNHTKYADLANFVADDLNHLGRRVGLSLYYQSRRSTLLR